MCGDHDPRTVCPNRSTLCPQLEVGKVSKERISMFEELPNDIPVPVPS